MGISYHRTPAQHLTADGHYSVAGVTYAPALRLKLCPGCHPGPGDLYGLFQTSTQNVFARSILVHSALYGFFDDNALHKFTYLLTFYGLLSCMAGGPQFSQ